MLNLKQYKIWHRIFEGDPELADRVLRKEVKSMKCKTLVFNNATSLYEIENEPDLVVLGVYERGGFVWVNGDFGDIENPETLRAALLDEPFEVDVKADGFEPISDDEPARALVVHAGRDNVWSAIQEMIAEYFENRA